MADPDLSLQLDLFQLEPATPRVKAQRRQRRQRAAGPVAQGDLFINVVAVDAMAAKATLYITGEPCKYGHVAERFVSSRTCVVCSRMFGAKYRKKNREKLLERKRLQNRKYRKQNPQKIRDQARQSRKKNLEKIREKNREYMRKRRENTEIGEGYKNHQRKYMRQQRELNPEKQREASRKWRAADPERAREYNRRSRAVNRERIRKYFLRYYKANRDAFRAHAANRRARERAAEGRHTYAEIVTLLEHQKYECAYCKTDLNNGYHADHIIPLSKGGSNWISNIQLTCPTCNLKKYNADPDEFALRIGSSDSDQMSMRCLDPS